jgi:hypothetical protein
LLLLTGAICTAQLHVPSTCAQQATRVGTSQAPPKQPADQKAATPDSKGNLSQFSWLVGEWRGQWGPRLAQQVWMPPQAGVMVGAFQVSENGRKMVIELYTITSTPRGVEVRVRHFTPSLTPWEKAGPTLLNLKTIDSKSILFENADNGQPKRWLMNRTAPDTLLERFEIVPEKGQEQVAEIEFHRKTASASATH